MSHRVFSDSSGRRWDVWSVVPNLSTDPTSGADGATHGDPGPNEPLAFTDPRWVNGWLAFQTPGEKRRLSPIPEAWMELGDADLEQLCIDAVRVQPSRRLIE
jgi:hypothetical protein